MNNKEIRFLYSVNPKKIIKNLDGVGAIRIPKSLYLTKEQVKECLKYGSVYRRFANENRNVRVTVTNIDLLHQEKFVKNDTNNLINDSVVNLGYRGSVIGYNNIEDKKENNINETSLNANDDKENNINETSLNVNDDKEETKITETDIDQINQQKNNKYNNGKNKHHK